MHQSIVNPQISEVWFDVQTTDQGVNPEGLRVQWEVRAHAVENVGNLLATSRRRSIINPLTNEVVEEAGSVSASLRGATSKKGTEKIRPVEITQKGRRLGLMGISGTNKFRQLPASDFQSSVGPSG